MTELALYRKYRPQRFEDLIGQSHIAKALKGAIEKDSVSHAYLFVGTRGVGKTSTARIFAKELGVSQKDLYELDAASNRGIDDFREIAESVHALPFESPYKIYIIDEVHMLTKEAFNAFLKTLEEPPAHVIFILATTNQEKVPETIKSRCQIHEFKRAELREIKDVISKVAKYENVDISYDALEVMSKSADGSFRDALMILQKAISLANGKQINLQDIEGALSIPQDNAIFDLLIALDENKRQDAFRIVQNLEEKGIDFTFFNKAFLDALRDVLIVRFADENTKNKTISKYTQENQTVLQKLAQESKKINSELIRKFISQLEFANIVHKKSLPVELFIAEYFESK